MMGRDNYSLVTTKVEGTSGFPLAWTDNHTTINGYNYVCLIADEVELV